MQHLSSKSLFLLVQAASKGIITMALLAWSNLFPQPG